MTSLAAATAATSLGKSQMLGRSLQFSSSARAAPAQSRASSSKIVVLFSKKKAVTPAKSKPAAVSLAMEELAKWYGPDRRIFLREGLLDRLEVPEYLNGEIPGDYGYDPFGLSKKPENFAKYQAYELIHAWWAILGASDPFHIAAGENPSLVLVSPILDGKNYHSCAWTMEQSLIAKNKFDFIDGTLKQPERTGKNYLAWRRCITLVLSWLRHSISPLIARSVLWINDAQEVWENLKACFSQGDLIRIFKLQEEIASVKQENLSVK